MSQPSAPAPQSLPVKVGDDLYVNEATIELLQRRIESQVLANFIKLIGIPVTGGGIVAVLIAAIYWIPSQVGKVIEENAVIKGQIADSVKNYLGEGQGKEFLVQETQTQLGKELPTAIGKQLDSAEIARLVAQKLPALVESYFAEGKGDTVLAQQLPPAVNGYLNGPTGQNLLVNKLNSHLASAEATALLQAEISKGVPAAVKEYLSQGPGKQQVERVVQGQIDDARVKQIIRDAVNDTLRSAAASRTRSLDANRSKAMIAIATPKVDKGGTPELEEFLRKPEVRAAGRERRPLAIGFLLGRRYVAEVIKTYIERTQEAFPGSDIYLVLHKPNGDCLAVCGPVIKDGRHETRLNEPAGRALFVEYVDATFNPDDFRPQRLAEIRLPVITAQLKATESLETALRCSVWKNPDDLAEQVAVVDGGEHFLGTTTRELLIATLLSP